MRTRERVIIYSILTVLVAINVSLLLGRSGNPAFADSYIELDDLGPAESVTLLGEGGAKDVVLRNRSGRLAWGDAAHDRVYSIAYVHIGKVLKQLMQAEEMNEERDRLVAELSEQETEFGQQLAAIRERLESMDPESEDSRATFEQGSALWDQYMAWQQQALARRGKLEAEQIETAYRELIEAVEVVADKKGVDTVYRFIPTEEAFEAANPEQAMINIRLRAALRYPKELDMTDDVLEELSLELE